MTLTEFIQQVKDTGVARAKMSGKSKPVLDFLALMEDTEPLVETDFEWWYIYLIGKEN